MISMLAQRTVGAIVILALLVRAPDAVSKQAGTDPKGHAAARRDEDEALKQAKEKYAKRIAEIEQATSKMIEAVLEKARHRAHEIKENESKTARGALLAAYDSAIQQAIESGDLERASHLTVEKQSVEGHGIPLPDLDSHQFLDNQMYKCLLGIYGKFGGPYSHPIVNLSVPNRNLWTEAIQSKLRGKIDFYEINYRGDAKLIIPEDGVYTVEVPDRGTEFMLNGKGLNRGNIELRKGVYRVRIATGTHGQMYLPGSFVRILRGGTDQEIPLINSGSDIKKFLASTIEGHAVVEVSGYRPDVVDPALLDWSSPEETTDQPRANDR